MRPNQMIASAGAFQQQSTIFHLIANNLSNAQTPGFKKDIPIFRNLFSQSVDRFQDIPIDEIRTLFHQGNIQKTGNELDLAIDGEGFFKVKTPDGIRYTRAGNFRLNKEKGLVNTDGFPIMGKQGEMSINGQRISVEKDGTIKVDGKMTDQIALVTLPDLGLLKKEGPSLFRLEGPQAEREVQGSQLLQGALESSNVNPIEEMVSLIDAHRSYESYLKVIQSNDEMDGKAVNELGRV